MEMEGIVQEIRGKDLLAQLSAQLKEETKNHQSEPRTKSQQARDQIAAANVTTEASKMDTNGIPPTADPGSKPTGSSADTEQPKPAGPPDVRQRAAEIMNRLGSGDKTARRDLKMFLDQHPEMWNCFGDLGEESIEAWIRRVAGSDEFFAQSIRHKVAMYRQELEQGIRGVGGKMRVDQVLTTWLQFHYADILYAQSQSAGDQKLESLARRQKQAQQQHTAALDAYDKWMKDHRVSAATPAPPSSGPKNNRRQPEDFPPERIPPGAMNPLNWILPFPGANMPKEPPAEAV